MQSASYYREQADRARRLMRAIDDPAAKDVLRQMAEDYDEIAEDLERGAIEIPHPARMPQRRHPR